MSWYYTFYVLKDTGEKNDKNEPIYTYAGALKYSETHNRQTSDTNEQRLSAVPLERRCRSSIDGEVYNNWQPIRRENLDDKAKEYLFREEYEDDYEPSEYECDHMNIKKFDSYFDADKNPILRRGFITIDEFDVAVACKYDPEFFEYEASVKSAEFIANLPENERAKYVPVSYLDIRSEAYIASVIGQACDMLYIWPNSNSDYYILCWQG